MFPLESEEDSMKRMLFLGIGAMMAAGLLMPETVTQAKPNSGISQRSGADKITRIERIDPPVLSWEWGLKLPAKIYGQGFLGSSSGGASLPLSLYAEMKMTHSLYTMKIEERHEGMIAFRVESSMPWGDYRLFLGYSPSKPLSNMFDFRFAEDFPYINSYFPNGAPVNRSANIVIQGTNFNLPHDSQYVRIELQGRWTNLGIDLWSDTLIKARLNPVALPGPTSSPSFW